jgi:DegV family protein with EDD domain
VSAPVPGAMDPARALDAGRTALVTDSSADVPPEARPANWRVVPIPVLFGDEALRDGVDIDAPTFYARLAAAERLPTTAQPSTEELADALRGALEAHETAVVLTITERMSGTVAAARAAAREVGEDRVLVIESGGVSVALGLMCLRVQARLERGTTAGALAADVQALRRAQSTAFSVETLEYLQRGGRVGRAQAAAGSLLRVRPILAIEGGEVVPAGRVRGGHRVVPALVDFVAARSRQDAVLHCAYVHAARPEAIPPLEEAVRAARPRAVTDLVSQMGPTVGTHAGPGTYALSFLHDPLDAEGAT